VACACAQDGKLAITKTKGTLAKTDLCKVSLVTDGTGGRHCRAEHLGCLGQRFDLDYRDYPPNVIMYGLPCDKPFLIRDFLNKETCARDQD